MKFDLIVNYSACEIPDRHATRQQDLGLELAQLPELVGYVLFLLGNDSLAGRTAACGAVAAKLGNILPGC
jgi:hypothetical protein